MADNSSSLPPRNGRLADRASRVPAKRRGLSLFRGVIILMVIAVLGMGGYAGYLFLEYKSTIGKIGTAGDVEPEERASEDPLSILVLGTDYREETRSANTDVIMVATLNPNSKSATLVSIPRDSYMDPEGLRENKANSFYSTYLFGRLSSAPEDREERQKYAMDKVKETFGKFLDVPIDYVSVVDFKTFTDVIDAYGGLTLTVDQNMCHNDYADGTHIKLSEGVNHLDGKNTLDFIRYRKSNNCSPKTPESSDFERNARQQQVISKLVEQMKKPQGVLKIGGVFDAVGDNVKTDIPSQQIEAMIRAYLGIQTDKINYIHLEGDWDGRFVRLSSEDVREASDQLNAQLAPEGPPQSNVSDDTVQGAGPIEKPGSGNE